MLSFASLLLASLLSLAVPSMAEADAATDNAEARVYFEEGNRLYQEAAAASGTRKTALLQRSLEAYVDSLQIARSRNALFNAAVVLGDLERYDESFNYLSEYLRLDELSAEDRAEAEQRRDALRAKVAVLSLRTEPAGARVWIDRKDLAPRGVTPLEVAVPPGEHRAFLEKDGHEPVERTQTIVQGQAVVVELALVPLPLQPALLPAEPVAKPESKPRLRNAAIGTAVGTLATAGVALGLSLRARTLREDADQAAEQYRMSGDPTDRQRAEDLADRTDRFNLAADVLWGTTIALGVSAIVLYGVHRRKQKREAPEVAVSVSRQGAFASVKMAFGGAQ